MAILTPVAIMYIVDSYKNSAGSVANNIQRPIQSNAPHASSGVWWVNIYCPASDLTVAARDMIRPYVI